jgi:AAA+ superfamily predicted ATPase
MMTVPLAIDVQATHAAEEEEEDAASKMVMAEELSCPICFKLMTDPVVAEDGQTYQRHAIEQWINKCITGMAPETKWGVKDPP